MAEICNCVWKFVCVQHSLHTTRWHKHSLILSDIAELARLMWLQLWRCKAYCDGALIARSKYVHVCTVVVIRSIAGHRKTISPLEAVIIYSAFTSPSKLIHQVAMLLLRYLIHPVLMFVTPRLLTSCWPDH